MLKAWCRNHFQTSDQIWTSTDPPRNPLKSKQRLCNQKKHGLFPGNLRSTNLQLWISLASNNPSIPQHLRQVVVEEGQNLSSQPNGWINLTRWIYFNAGSCMASISNINVYVDLFCLLTLPLRLTFLSLMYVSSICQHLWLIYDICTFLCTFR